MRVFNRRRKSLGQTTVEYAIIVALIAIAAIGVYMLFGESMVNLVEVETRQLEGDDSATRTDVDTSGVRKPTLDF